MTDEKWNMTYSLKVERKENGYSRKEVEKLSEQDEYLGACDALIFISIVRPAWGGKSILIIDKDGDLSQKRVPDYEMFMVMLTMAKKLLESDSLHLWQLVLCRELINGTRRELGD
jgi:hypothetical protein